MKNKSGFTLAEILITLSIIGVVAAITIPALVKNIEDNKYKSAWKKGFSTLMNSYTKAHSENGDFSSFSGVDAFADTFLTSFIVNTRYLTTDTNMNHGWTTPYYLKDGTSISLAGSSSYFSRAVLNDGTYLLFGSYNFAATCTYNAWPTGAPQSCGFVCIDVNGAKKPNTNGKDIFCAWITKNKLIPYGGAGDTLYTTNTCDTTGYGCAAKYIME